MAVCFLPHRTPHRWLAPLAAESLARAAWCGQAPAGVGVVADLSAADHVVVLMSSRALLAGLGGLRCRVSLLMHEPPAIHERYYRLLPWIHRRYHRILSHSPRVLAACPNARYVPHGNSWLRRAVDPDAPKSERIALIASAKRSTEGHRLRHRIAAWSRRAAPDLALLGGGYRPLDDKAEGHLPYRFSVVIENSREPGYFTEKLVDSLLCGSVPIYWGAPDIDRYFDPAGMIACASEAELREAIRWADTADFEARRPALRGNHGRAERYADFRSRCAEVLASDRDLEPGPRGSVGSSRRPEPPPPVPLP